MYPIRERKMECVLTLYRLQQKHRQGYAVQRMPTASHNGQ